MAKYDKDRSFRVTVVDGTVKTGLYAKDGSTNVVHAPLIGGGSGGASISTNPILATWNPSDQFEVTITNSNRTIASISSNTPGGRGDVGITSGKYYFESTMDNWSGGATCIGVATSTAAFGSLLAGQATATKTGGGVNGSIYINGANSGSALGPRINGDIIGVAVDLTARLVWFRVSPAGNWNGSGTASPATGTGGLSIAALTGPLYPYFGAAATGQQTTGNFGQSAFSGAVPVGFTSGWSYTPPLVATTWSTIDKTNITLSNSDLTATNSANVSGVRGNIGTSSGKYYFEILGTGSFTGMGIARGNTSFTALNPMGSAVVNPGGIIYVNTGNTGATISACNGVRVDVAVDLTASKIWFRNSSTGLWNGNAGANPANGLGFVDIDVMNTEIIYPFFGTNTATGMSATVNFSGPFGGTPPAGFTSWTTSAPGPGARLVGTYHPCGALNVLRTTGPVFKLRAPNGAMWVTTTPYTNRGTKITIVSGTLP